MICEAIFLHAIDGGKLGFTAGVMDFCVGRKVGGIGDV